MINILITGIDGFVASTLTDHILSVSKEHTIFGTVRRMADRKNIQHQIGQIHLIDMELTDYNSVENAVRISRPDLIFHLAAQSFVPTSWTAPGSTLETNVIGTSNLLEAVRKLSPNAFVQIAGSSEEYGMVQPSECPITEDQPLRPLSPYAVSKVATDRLGYQYAKSYGMNIVVTRSFNMTGPRRGSEFVDSNWAKQIVNIERGKYPPMIYHGNLSAVRDFTDVRDSVRAYWMLANMDRKHDGDVVQVCTGQGYMMDHVLTTLINMTTNDVPISHMDDPKRFRPSDVPLLVGSNAKLKSLISWEPEIPFVKSMRDLLDYWRSQP
jgi:GDP-4-dehydro-6-deoxy-D-mannose reductase